MNRLEKVQKLVEDSHLSALVIDNPLDIYYLIERRFSLARLVVSQKEAVLFVDGRYFEACHSLTDLSVVLTAGYGKESAFFKFWKWKNEKVGFDSEYTTYAAFENLKNLNCDWVPLRHPIKHIRATKDDSEILKLKKAALLGSKGFDYVCSLLKEGAAEKELAIELEIFWLKEGGEKLSFTPHIAFGEGTSQPHYQLSDRKLRKGDLVLIDIGVVVDHYHSDMTRVLSFGSASLEMKKIYEIVYEAHQAAIKRCKPGALVKDVDDAARSSIEQQGYGEYFPHALGHGVGLEIHESPRLHFSGSDSDSFLQKGMVITIEPGIYIPGVGGVRLEDTLVITETGCQNITNRPFPPKLPIV